MGQEKNATCRECGHRFTIKDGGGFHFHLLRCEECGSTKDIGFDELGEIHLRYLKGLEAPYCIATSEHDEYVRENYDGEPLEEEEYESKVEEIAGKCKCGGQFRFDAKPRCPKCKSVEIEEGEVTVYYD